MMKTREIGKKKGKCTGKSKIKFIEQLQWMAGIFAVVSFLIPEVNIFALF